MARWRYWQRCNRRLGLSAQSAATLTVEDSSGVALAGAAVEDSQGKLLGRTGADGRLTVACAAPCRVRVRAEGFAERDFELTGDTTIRLEPAAVAEQVTVTAYRAPLGSLESPVTTRLLSEKALNTTARSPWTTSCGSFPAWSCFGGPVRWWPIPHRRESACAGWVLPRPAALCLLKTMCR